MFKNTVVYGLVTVLPRLLTVLLTYLLSEYLEDDVAFGEASIVFSYIIFANVVLSYGMETAFFRFYHEEGLQKKTLGTALISLLFTSLTAALCCYLLLPQIEGATGLSAAYWQWVIAIVAIDALAVIPFAYLRAREKTMRYAVIKMVNVVITVGMTLLFFTILPSYEALESYLPTDRIELYFIAMLASSSVTFLWLLPVYFRKLEFDRVLWQRMLSYGWPILLAGLAFAVNETLDKILLERWLPMDRESARATVASYTAGYRLAVGMTLFAQAFRLGVEPFFFSQAREKNALDQYALITKAFIAIGSIVLVAYITLVDLIAPILIGSKVSPALEVVPVVLMAYFFSGIYQSLSVWYKIQDKTRYGAYISIVAAVLTIALNYFLIPVIGFMASAYATCAAYGLMMVVSYLWGRRHLPVPYDMGKLLSYLLLSLGLSLIFFYIVRPNYGIETLKTYLVGGLFVAVMLGFVCFRESLLIKKLLKRP